MLGLRKATLDDVLIIYNWRNDIDVIKYSFDNEYIKYEDHLKWFKDKLSSKYSVIYILENNKLPIGIVRLDDINSYNKLISFSIDKNYRGLGYGSKLLELIKMQFDYYILIGKVKKDNIASIKAFQKAGYYMNEEPDMYIFYSKDYKL